MARRNGRPEALKASELAYGQKLTATRNNTTPSIKQKFVAADAKLDPEEDTKHNRMC